MGWSGLASRASAASPAGGCCRVYCARTGIGLKRDWNVGTSMGCSESFRDSPSCANNPSIERTSSSSTLNAPLPVPVPAPVPGRPAAPPAAPLRNKAEAVSHFPGVVPSPPAVATPPPAPVPPLPPPNPPPPAPPPPLPVPVPPPWPPPGPVPPPVPAPPTPAAAGAHALRSQNHLQHLVRIFEEISKLFARRAEHFLRELRGNFDPRHRGIFRHVANFIHLDARISRQRGF